MSAQQPNVVFFVWDNLGWGEVGCYVGGVLRGAPTPRIDALAAEGPRLQNFNYEFEGGTIQGVAVSVGDDVYMDLEKQAAAAFARD